MRSYRELSRACLLGYLRQRSDDELIRDLERWGSSRDPRVVAALTWGLRKATQAGASAAGGAWLELASEHPNSLVRASASGDGGGETQSLPRLEFSPQSWKVASERWFLDTVQAR